MGTSKPLRIAVHFQLTHLPCVLTLRDKGHHVFPIVSLAASDTVEPIDSFDLVLGPNCMRFIPGMEKFLESFLKGARAARYPGSKRNE